MPCVIVIGGAPGCGKSTLAAALRAHLRCPHIDFGKLREFHLQRDWSDASEREESMAFENLLGITRNYLRHGYEHVIIDDLRYPRVLEVPHVLSDVPVRIVTLILSDEAELRRRIDKRTEGFRDADLAARWNGQILASPPKPGEARIDVAGKSPEDVLREAMDHLVQPPRPSA